MTPRALLVIVVVVSLVVVRTSCRIAEQGEWLLQEEPEIEVGRVGRRANKVGSGDDIWCEPTPLPTDDFFITSPSAWWKDFYSYQNSEDKKLTFKVYPTVWSVDMFVGIYTREGDCPLPQPGGSNHFAWHINTPVMVQVDYQADTLLLVHVHNIGGNYILMGCTDNTCIDYCPNDCSSRGWCNVTTSSSSGGGGTCVCAPHAAGDDCRNATCTNCHPKKRAPFGSYTLFYSIVAGVPTILVLLTISLVAYRLISRQDQSRMYSKIGPLEGESINSDPVVVEERHIQPQTSRIV